MKEITKLMIREFKIKELGMDFMAYQVTDKSPISFHHTIISHKKCLQDGLGHGYWKWNGSCRIFKKSLGAFILADCCKRISEDWRKDQTWYMAI